MPQNPRRSCSGSVLTTLESDTPDRSMPAIAEAMIAATTPTTKEMRTPSPTSRRTATSLARMYRLRLSPAGDRHLDHAPAPVRAGRRGAVADGEQAAEPGDEPDHARVGAREREQELDPGTGLLRIGGGRVGRDRLERGCDGEVDDEDDRELEDERDARSRALDQLAQLAPKQPHVPSPVVSDRKIDSRSLRVSMPLA